jgi:hypothetical protein
VNERGGYVKCEKSKQPENNQDCCDDPKHVFISSLLGAKNVCDFVLLNGMGASSSAEEDCEDCTAGRLALRKTEVCAVVNTYGKVPGR